MLVRWRLVIAALVVLAVLGFRAAGGSAALEEPAAGRLRITVMDATSGAPLPCRVTLRDAGGGPLAVRTSRAPGLAVRPGVVYTGSGRATVEAPAGRLTLYATRGPEYGLARRSLTLRPGETVDVRLALRREVDAAGYVSCDAHTHTLTYGGHGDASVEERVVTLAGEGIEMAVASEHNRHVSYVQAAEAAGVSRFFTPVTGNEVTSRVGHFGIFPVAPQASPPPVTPPDRAGILAAIRATPGVRAVVLHHPCDLHEGFLPADPARFHLGSGESLDGLPWSVDAIEVINSGAARSDFMEPFRVWFALLNHGQRTVAVAGSDSHDVDGYIVGQGRTYLRGADSAPDRVDVPEVCDSLLAGRALVSLGLFTEVWVNGRFTVGDLATLGTSDRPSDSAPEGAAERRDALSVRVKVQGPGWISADRVELWANGEKVAERVLKPRRGAGGVKADLTFRLPRPRQDLWLVAIASGPGDTAPFWALSPPYQPSRLDWEPRVIGATNPIRVDGDGDGRYSSPADYARAALEASGGSPQGLMERLARYDAATAAQAASLCRAQGIQVSAGPFRKALQAAPPAVRYGFAVYQNLLPPAPAR